MKNKHFCGLNVDFALLSSCTMHQCPVTTHRSRWVTGLVSTAREWGVAKADVLRFAKIFVPVAKTPKTFKEAETWWRKRPQKVRGESHSEGPMVCDIKQQPEENVLPVVLLTGKLKNNGGFF